MNFDNFWQRTPIKSNQKSDKEIKMLGKLAKVIKFLLYFMWAKMHHSFVCVFCGQSFTTHAYLKRQNVNIANNLVKWTIKRNRHVWRGKQSAHLTVSLNLWKADEKGQTLFTLHKCAIPPALSDLLLFWNNKCIVPWSGTSCPVHSRTTTGHELTQV